LTATDEERRVLADRSPIMKTAVDALTNLSLDPEAQRIAWERDRNERGWRHMMGSARQAGHEEGHEKGREEGREEGRQEKAAMLAQLLAKKFGPLAEAQRERVEGADGATLKRWFEAFLDAVSIDDLLRQ
jgi:flagellar biosynthesis/type III secretory pathway protein FliH